MRGGSGRGCKLSNEANFRDICHMQHVSPPPPLPGPPPATNPISAAERLLQRCISHSGAAQRTRREFAGAYERCVRVHVLSSACSRLVSGAI